MKATDLRICEIIFISHKYRLLCLYLDKSQVLLKGTWQFFFHFLFFWAQVKGQRLVYKFNNLPYTYKPGITRSFYRDRFPTPISSLGEHEPREYKPLVPQMRIGFTTATQPFPCYIPSQGRLSSWPVHPINSPRVCCCVHRLGTSISPANCNSRSRVFFPCLSLSGSHGFKLN